ncbi:MAG: hypothetical protein IKP34_05080, partial [Bacteroidales bacterium]|nr:hypothetical protein [Bacteroidales bacterium]
MNRILLTNGMRKYLLMAALMLAAVLPAQATDYVITYTTGNTTYYLGMNGNTLQAKTTFDVTCIWTCYNGNNEASLGNTSYSLRNKENASAYLTTSCSRSYNWGWQYSWNALTVQNSASNIWRSSNGTNGNVYAYFSGSGYGTWNHSASIYVNTLSMEDDNTTDSKNYSVTTTPVAATLTGVSINGESTLSTTGAHSYTLTDGSYTNASTNYYFNGTDHYYPAQTTTTETPVGTWSVSGTGASYVSVDENTGTITVNSLPTDGDKTITLSCDPMYGTAHGATVTKTITLKARCQTPTFSFNNTNNQVTITTG